MVAYEVEEMEEHILRSIVNYYYDVEGYNNLHIGDNSIRLSTIEAVHYSGGGHYVVLNGICNQYKYSETNNRTDYYYPFRIFLNVDYDRYFQVEQVVEDIEPVGDTLIENYDPLALMYLYNAVMYNETSVYRYYINSKMYNPNAF